MYAQFVYQKLKISQPPTVAMFFVLDVLQHHFVTVKIVPYVEVLSYPISLTHLLLLLIYGNSGYNQPGVQHMPYDSGKEHLFHLIDNLLFPLNNAVIFLIHVSYYKTVLFYAIIND